MKKYITKQSNIKGAGKGLFTKAPFKKGEVIGLAHVDDQPYLEIGHNHNHDEKNPTAFSKKIDNKRYIFASRDLDTNEEITTNYRLQPELEQPEDFQKKKGGMVSLPRDKPEKSKKFSRSLDATNRLFTENNLFKKPKSRKNKVFDPHAKYYAEGGTYEEAELTPEEIEAYRAEGYTVDDNEYQDGDDTDAMNGMMKARLAYANEFGNPAAKRMINLPDTPYQFDNGDTGTHYMASMDNYAVPQIQDENGVLQLGDYGPESNEAIRFDSDEDANYFAENYKDVSPGFLNEKQYGGLNKFVGGGEPCPEGYVRYKGRCIEWQEPNVIETDENTGYNAATGDISQDTRPGSIENNGWWTEHEKYHHLQNLAGDMSTAGFLGQRPNNTVASDQAIGDYYNKRDTELEAQTDAMIKADPNLQFIPRNKLQGFTEGFPGADALMYQDSNTEEGGARVREEEFEKDGISMFPQKKHGGLHKLQEGGSPYYSYGNKKYIKKKDGTWFIESNGKYVPLTENVKARTAELNKNAKYNSNYHQSQAFRDKLRKGAGKMYIPENQRKGAQAWNNYNDGPINMVHPEKYVIGPGGGVIGLGSTITRNLAGLGIKGLNKAMSYIPAPVSGALNAYFGVEGIKEFSDPNSLTRKSMSRASDDPTASNIGDAAFDVGMNSLNFVGLPLGKAIKGLKKYSKPLINSIDNAIYPTRTYRAEVPGGNLSGWDASDLSKKVFKKGDFSTKSLDEVTQYLIGSETEGGRQGLVTGQDMLLTEFKVPFWKKNILSDPDVVALKKSNGFFPNSNEYLIPKNKLLYPRKTTLIKAVPEELKTFQPDIFSGSGYLPYEPFSSNVIKESSNFASKPYKYVEDQLNAVTGHNMPFTFKFDPTLSNQVIPIRSWKQPQFPVNKRFKKGGDLPPKVGVSYLPKGERSYYDPIMDNISLDLNASEGELNHEMAHAWQNRQDGFRSDPYSPKLRPSAAASDEQAATYFNRKGDDVDRYINNLNTIVPELGGHTWNKDIDTFIPDQIKYDKVIDPLMYSDPTTLEGEAEYMAQVYGRPPLEIRKQGGLHKFIGGGPTDCGENMRWDEALQKCVKDQDQKLPETTVSALGKEPDNIEWYESWNPRKWGLNDYSEYSSFDSAFKNARKSKEQEFVYKGKRYTTLLEEDKLKQNKKYKEALDYTEAYMQSPKYKEMLKRSSNSKKEYRDMLKDRFLNLKSIPSLKILPQQPKDELDTGAYSSSGSGQITMLPLGFNSNGTYTHELSHSVDRPTGFDINTRLIPESDRNYINKHKAKSLLESRKYKQDPAWYNMDFETKNKQFKEFYTDYVGEDTETRARLNSIREKAKENNLYDPFTQGVSPDLYFNTLKDFQFDTDGFNPMNQLKGAYSDEEIIWMLNNISKNENKQEEGIEEGVGKKGGYIDLELTPEEIEEYRRGGFTVEEIY